MNARPQLDTIVAVVSYLYDGDDSPPACYVRVENNKYEAVVTILHEDRDEEVVIGRFDDCNTALRAIWTYQHQESLIHWWHPPAGSKPN